MAPWWLFLAQKCYSHKRGQGLFSYVSSSGGGLPGRQATRESRDARLIFGELIYAGAHFSRPSRKVESTNHQLLITASKW